MGKLQNRIKKATEKRFQARQNSRQQLRRLIANIRNRASDLSPDEAEAIAAEAVSAVRKISRSA